jgi:hypothetical protein
MKTRFLLFGLVFAAIVFLFKRLLDTQEKLVIAEAELTKLQREQAAIEETFTEANARYEDYNAANPLPDDPDRKMRIAMLDAILGADAREELGENYLDEEEES